MKQNYLILTLSSILLLSSIYAQEIDLQSACTGATGMYKGGYFYWSPPNVNYRTYDYMCSCQARGGVYGGEGFFEIYMDYWGCGANTPSYVQCVSGSIHYTGTCKNGAINVQNVWPGEGVGSNLSGEPGVGSIILNGKNTVNMLKYTLNLLRMANDEAEIPDQDQADRQQDYIVYSDASGSSLQLD